MSTCFTSGPKPLTPRYNILAGDIPTLNEKINEALNDDWHLHGGLVFDQRSGMLVQAVVRNLPPC